MIKNFFKQLKFSVANDSKQVDMKLRESEEKMRLISETAPDAIVIMDNSGNIQFWNRAAEKIFGYTAKEVIGKSLHLLLAPSRYHDAYEKGFAHYQKSGEGPMIGKTQQLEGLKKDGTEISVEVSFSIMQLKGERHAIGMIRDITERKKTEQDLQEIKNNLEKRVAERTAELEQANRALQEEIVERKNVEKSLQKSEERWLTTVASIGDAVIATDLEGRITFMNNVAEKLTGWFFDEAMQEPIHRIFNVISESTRKKFKNPVERVIEEGRVVNLENHTILLRKDDTEIVIDDSGAPIKNLNGEMVGVVLVFRDVTKQRMDERELQEAKDKLEIRVKERTRDLEQANDTLRKEINERKKIEDKLRHSEKNLKEAQQIAHMGSWQIDLHDPVSNADDNPLHWSDEVFCIFGYEPGKIEATNELFFKHVHPQDRQKIREAVGAALEKKSTYKIEHRIITVDGKQRIVLEQAAVILESSGQPIRLVGTILDITERKAAEEKIKRANAYNRSLIEASLDPLVTIGPEGKITDVNKATVDVTGVSRENLIGSDFSTYFTQQEKARKGYEDVFKKGQITDYPLTIRHADGKKLTDVLYNAVVYKDEQGKILGVFAAARDVTASKKAEQELKAHTKELEKINKIMVGREMKMIELKKEINEYKK